MTSSVPVSEELLRSAFALSESRLMGDDNFTVAQRITNEAKRVQYEGSLNAILLSALSGILPECSVSREYNKIDIVGIHDNGVVVAIESKGTVANSHSSDRNRISLDVHGVRTKLYPDKRDTNSVQTDIAEISSKIPVGMECSRFEIFVPVIYELYREGGDQSDWFSERKPWVTLPRFKELRSSMKDDLVAWFHREDPRVCRQNNLVHSTRARIWQIARKESPRLA